LRNFSRPELSKIKIKIKKLFNFPGSFPAKTKKTNAAVVKKETALSVPEKNVIIKEVDHLTRQVSAFKITDEKSRVKSTELLTLVKNKFKEVEKKKDSIVKPIKDSVKLIEKEFKLILDPLENLESIIKAEIRRDYIAREEEARKARLKAEAEEQRKLNSKKLQDQLNSDNELQRALAQNKIEQIKQDTIIKAPEAIRAILTGTGTASIRKIKKYEVTDFSKLPDEYKMIDAGKITAAIRSGKLEIPGLRIYEDTIVGANSN